MDPIIDITPILEGISGVDIIAWFFKAFAILLSFMFLLYAFIVYRQTEVMNKTITRKSGPFLLFISFIQIALAVLLIFLSIIVL